MKRKNPGRGISLPAGIAIGSAASIAVALIGALVLAYMVSNESVSLNGVGIGAAIILILSTIVGALTATALTKRQKLMVTGLAALTFFLALLSVTVIFFDGAFGGVGKSALMIILGAGASLLPGLRKKAGKNKIKIPAYR